MQTAISIVGNPVFYRCVLIRFIRTCNIRSPYYNVIRARPSWKKGERYISTYSMSANQTCLMIVLQYSLHERDLVSSWNWWHGVWYNILYFVQQDTNLKVAEREIGYWQAEECKCSRHKLRKTWRIMVSVSVSQEHAVRFSCQMSYAWGSMLLSW